VSIFHRISRAIQRFNRSMEKTALASSVEPGGGVTGGPASAVNPMGVKVVLGEIEKDVSDAEREDKQPNP
jgi:hypothetical protein